MRNVLFEVYGLESSTYHIGEDYPLDENFDQFPVIKTHLLPQQLPFLKPEHPVVFLVRDGRDCIVSLAHHHKSLRDPNADVDQIMQEAIIAAKGSYFGGWSENTKAWIDRADIIIQFSDLIKDPIACCERLRGLIQLPEPQRSKLPGFDDLKHGRPKYGAGVQFADSEEAVAHMARSNFRRGKTGGWKEEMPEELQVLFWNHHGEVMERMGFSNAGENSSPDSFFEKELCQKLGIPINVPKKRRKILVEADKLMENGNDGIKRYEVELLKQLQFVNPDQAAIDVLLNGLSIPIAQAMELQKEGKLQSTLKAEKVKEEVDVQTEVTVEHGYETSLLSFKAQLYKSIPKWLYQPLASVYKMLPFRALLSWFRNLAFSIKNKLLQKGPFAEYDLVHIPLPQHLIPFKSCNSPMLLTVHDLTHKSHPQFHQDGNIENCLNGFEIAKKSVRHSICISQSTKSDLKLESPRLARRSTVIYEAADANSFKSFRDDEASAALRKKYSLPHIPYLLSLSTIEPRKNLGNTIKAFMDLVERWPEKDFGLFLCGKHGWKTEELMEGLNFDPQRVIFTGFIDEADLCRLYNDARALCYISHYEGFGLPPVEAMRCGTPVLYGDNSSMPEVIGQGGIALDSQDTQAISEAMESILFDDDLRNRLSFEALKRSNDFSWRNTARQHLDLYLKYARKS